MQNKKTSVPPAKLIESELTELIKHTHVFSSNLKKVLKDFKHDDIASERKATVEVLRVILQKWAVETIHVLFISGPLRFNDLKRELKGISSRTLTSKLRLLEDAGIITRIIVSQRPTIAEYSLTEKGRIIAELSCPIICYLKLQCS